MIVRFFKNFKKQTNETKIPSSSALYTEFNLHLKDKCSITHPVFLIDHIETEWNYAYVPSWKRYYFIGNINLNNNEIMELTLDVDPMASYRSDIFNYSIYIERAAGDHDGKLIDNLYPASGDMNIQKTAFTSPFVSNWIDCRWILGVTGQNANGIFGSVAYYAFTHADVGVVLGDLFADAGFPGIFQSSENPAQYIVSCMAVPISTLGGHEAPYLGNWTPTHANGEAITNPVLDAGNITLSLPSHPQVSSHGEWVKHAPYTKHTLYFEPFGCVEIDSNMLMNATSNNIYLNVKIDQISGAGTLTIRINSNSGPVIARVNRQIGVPIAVSSGLRTTVGEAAGAIAGIATSVGLAATGNYLGAGLAATTTIASALESQFPKIQTSGANGSFLPLSLEPCVVSEFTTICAIDNTHSGRPLCQVRTLGNMSGFVKCLNADVPIAGLDEEKTAINAYLNSGAYIN